MSTKQATPEPPEPKVSRAEDAFRQAFVRLKTNNVRIVPKGTSVTQNNVAREAGLDPSALRRSRYPELVEDIKAWVSTQTPKKSVCDTAGAARERLRVLQERNDQLVVQRDQALCRLVEAEARIVELTIELECLAAKLPASNVTPLRGEVHESSSRPRPVK